MEIKQNNFTIYEVEEIKEELKSILSEEKICLDLKNVNKIDMSAIQLLISMKKSCDEQNKPFEIVNIKEEIIDSFQITGTAYILGV